MRGLTPRPNRLTEFANQRRQTTDVILANAAERMGITITGNTQGVDPRLLGLAEQAWGYVAPGGTLNVTTGVSNHSPVNHAPGHAIDFAMRDAEGNIIGYDDPRQRQAAMIFRSLGGHGVGFGRNYMGGQHSHWDISANGPRAWGDDDGGASDRGGAALYAADFARADTMTLDDVLAELGLMGDTSGVERQTFPRGGAGRTGGPNLSYGMDPVAPNPMAGQTPLGYDASYYENLPAYARGMFSGDPIAARLIELANAPMQPVPAPQAPQTTQPARENDLLSGKAIRTYAREPSPNEGNPDIRNQSPQEFEETLNRLYPAPVGQPATGEVVRDAIYPLAEGVAEARGLPVEDAPTTPAQIAEAYQDPGPDADDESEEAERRRNRRLLAADMLEVLSVGLGQMAAGQGVNVSGPLQGQRERRMLSEQQELERQQMQAQQQAVAQELQALGMGSMARLALSGPAGLETAMRALGEVTTRQATAGGGGTSAVDMLGRLSPEQRMELLVAQGIDPDTAAAVAPFADFTAQLYEQAVMPDMAAAEAERVRQAEEARAMDEAASLYGLAFDNGLANDPRVQPALAAINANPLDEGNRSALRTALQEAGIAAAETTATSGPLTDLEARAFGGRLTPEQLELARTDAAYADTVRAAQAAGMTAGAERLNEELASRAVDTETAMAQADTAVSVGAIPPSLRDFAVTNGVPAAIEMQTRLQQDFEQQQRAVAVAQQATQFAQAFPPEARGLFTGITNEADLRNAIEVATEQYGPTSQERLLRALERDPELLATELRLRRSQGAGDPLPPVMEALIETTVAQHQERRANVTNRVPLVDAMNMLIGQLSAEGVDRSAGGPLAPLLAQMQAYSDQLGLGVEFTGDVDAYLTRLTAALSGEFAQSFRLEGSGATSDLEFSNFMQAGPQAVDSYMRQLGMAQRIIRMQELERRSLELEEEYLRQNARDPDALTDSAAMREYVDTQMSQMNYNVFPELNWGGENYQQELARDIATGNITRETVVRVVRDGEARYVMYGDFVDEIERTLGVRLPGAD